MPQFKRNECNAGQGEGFQVECGAVRGIGRSRTEGAAFRRLLKIAGKRAPWGELARFRVIRLKGHRPLSPWFYIEPSALLERR